MAREMNVDVVRRVIGAVPGQLDPLAPDLQGVAVGEGHLRYRPGRVVVPQQEPPGLLVPDAGHVPAEQRGRGAVVGVMVGSTRWVTRLVTPLAAAISSTARCRLWPMDGGASNNTTPSSVVRKAIVNAVMTQYRFRSTRPT